MFLKMSSFRFVLKLWALTLLPLSIYVNAQDSSLTATVSINKDPGWITERDCGKKCVWIDTGHYGSPNTDIVMHINCGAPYLNACLCRTDLGASVTTFLSSCVSSRCQSDGISDYTTEVFTAVSLYSHYCNTAAGVNFPAPTVTAIPGSVSGCPTLTTITVTMSESAQLTLTSAAS